MRLTDLLGAFRRRFIILIIGLLVTAAAVTGAVSRVEPTYTAQASIVLLPPRSAGTGGSNPFLSLQGLTQALDVLTISLNQRVAEEIPSGNQRRIDLGPDLSGSAFNRNSDGPILQVSVRSDTAASSLAYLDDVVALVAPTLEQIQTDIRVPTNTQVYSQLIATDKQPAVSQQPRIRAAFVVFIVFFLLTCFLVVAIDRWLTGRRTRRLERAKERLGASSASTGKG